MNTLDKYYQQTRYKNKEFGKRSKYLDKRMRWIRKVLGKNFCGNILDVGCGDGSMMFHLRKLQKNNLNIFGVDISETGCALARKKGVKAKQSDLNKKIPFKKGFFDFIICHEIIEHLIDPDTLFLECNRVLKKSGCLIITTPNLTAWYNRILFLLGIPPLFSEMSTRNRRVGIGFMKICITNSQPVGHLRIFTVSALKDLAKLYNFKIIKLRGSPLGQKSNIIDYLFSYFPSLSSNILVILEKK